MTNTNLILAAIIVVAIMLLIHGYIMNYKGSKVMKELEKEYQDLLLENKELKASLEFANRKPLRYTPHYNYSVSDSETTCGLCGDLVGAGRHPCPTDNKFYCRICRTKTI